MLKVCITGGIGAGKTTVCKAFEWYGVPIFNTDREVKSLYSLEGVRSQVISLLGDESYTGYNPNFTLISDKIFRVDELKRRLTNDILYPKLWAKLDQWYSLHNNKAYVLVESALVFELNIQSRFDKTILVYVNLEERIKRSMLRDNATRDNIIQRINGSISEESKISMSDYVIINENEYDLYDQIESVHYELLKG